MKNEGQTLIGAFAYYDVDVIGTADIYEFTDALRYFGCNFKSNEFNALFEQYNYDKSGQIDAI